MAEEKKILQRRGSFRCADKRAEYCGALCIAGAMMTVLVLVLNGFSLGEYMDSFIDAMMAACFILVIAVLSAWVFFAVGQECEFEAREDEFEIIGPKEKREIFYYNDVIAVTYSQIHKGAKLRGYNVTIVTGVRRISYRFVFSPNAEYLDTDSTPFYYLEVNSGLREETKLAVDHEAVLSHFESKRRGQKKGKNAKSERTAELLEDIDKTRNG